MDRVLVVCDDLFFRVNLDALIRQSNLLPLAVARLSELESALAPELPGTRPTLRAAIVDLHTRSGESLAILARLAETHPGMPVLAFGSHVEREVLEQARAAGAVAMPRSQFVREFPGFMARIAVGVSPAAPPPGAS